MPEFKQIAVIGAGTMGSGIAAQIANAGNKVLLMDLPRDDDPIGVLK
ncbi:3-hydroxyacyl-CoA dehydrogenase NAD-binding domain-containing protein, partial [Amylibacter sp.]|nr:3-hydroxyacyl-CoA dehydrogenase NAD-binding domain-containing protein [Amylibacter sp.]